MGARRGTWTHRTCGVAPRMVAAAIFAMPPVSKAVI